jgi:hypothetical protein
MNAQSKWIKMVGFNDTKSVKIKQNQVWLQNTNTIGGISRRGRTKLLFFSSNNNTAGYKKVASQFISSFVAEKSSTYH